MSTTRLLILGLVRWLQPVHGYDIRRELLSWNVEHWANIQPGSVYHALRKLTEDDMLEEVATEQVGGRPARTTYRMTPKGDAEFVELLHKYWWEYRPPLDPFCAAMSLMPALPRDEAVAALRNRARQLRLTAEQMRGLHEGGRTWMRHKPPHVGWMFELTAVHAEAEATWCDRVAERVEAGEGAHVGEAEEMASTRAWRRTMGATGSTDGTANDGTANDGTANDGPWQPADQPPGRR